MRRPARRPGAELRAGSGGQNLERQGLRPQTRLMEATVQRPATELITERFSSRTYVPAGIM